MKKLFFIPIAFFLVFSLIAKIQPAWADVVDCNSSADPLDNPGSDYCDWLDVAFNHNNTGTTWEVRYKYEYVRGAGGSDRDYPDTRTKSVMARTGTTRIPRLFIDHSYTGYRVHWATTCADPTQGYNWTNRDGSRPDGYELYTWNINIDPRDNRSIGSKGDGQNLGTVEWTGGDNNFTAGSTTGCYQPRYEIGGYVFVDENRDGNRDSGEPLYAGARVDKTGDGDPEHDYTNSSGDTFGEWLFYNLRRDTYRIRLTVPSGYVATNDRDRTFSIPPNRSGIGFGIARNRWDINVNIFLDRNRDGDRDSNDPLFTARRVYVVKRGDSYERKSTTDGSLSFTSLPRRSDYTVTMEVPSGYSATTSTTRTTSLPSNSSSGNRTVSFGLNTTPDYDIQGTVFVDENNNGSLDASDTDLGNVTTQIKSTSVSRYDTDDNRLTCNAASCNHCGQTVTRGQFRFCNNNPGTYNIRVVNPNPAIYTVASTNPRTTTVNNANVTGQNFRLIRQAEPPPTYTVRGGVILDRQDPRGQKSSAEPYFQSSSGIRILGRSGTPNPAQTTYSSNTTNGFTITGLIAGNYQVQYTNLPATHQMTWPSNDTSPPPSFDITVGGSCNDGGHPAADCVDGNIEDLFFGVEPIPASAWFQTATGNMRIDQDLIDKIPGVSGTICPARNTQAYASVAIPNSGVGMVISAQLNPDLGGASATENKARSNIRGWFVTDAPFKGSVKTSYDYVKTQIARNGITPVNGWSANEDGPCSGQTSESRPECNFEAVPSRTNVYIFNTRSGDAFAVDMAGTGTYNFTANSDSTFLINGNLRISRNMNVPVGSTATFIVRGDIEIDPDVTNIEGLFSADGDFIVHDSTSGTDSRLIIEGSIVANAGGAGGAGGGKFINDRDLGDGTNGNGVCPAVTVVQRPDFLLNLPETIRVPSYTVQEGN